MKWSLSDTSESQTPGTSKNKRFKKAKITAKSPAKIQAKNPEQTCSELKTLLTSIAAAVNATNDKEIITRK